MSPSGGITSAGKMRRSSRPESGRAQRDALRVERPAEDKCRLRSNAESARGARETAVEQRAAKIEARAERQGVDGDVGHVELGVLIAAEETEWRPVELVFGAGAELGGAVGAVGIRIAQFALDSEIVRHEIAGLA